MARRHLPPESTEDREPGGGGDADPPVGLIPGHAGASPAMNGAAGNTVFRATLVVRSVRPYKRSGTVAADVGDTAAPTLATTISQAKTLVCHRFLRAISCLLPQAVILRKTPIVPSRME